MASTCSGLAVKPEGVVEAAPRVLTARWSTTGVVRRGLGYAALAFVGACAALPGGSLDVHGEAEAIDFDGHRNARR